MPTLISIKDCRDRANISYRFGYDATINANRNNYNTLQSIFYGIKKWVNNYKKLEEVIDENGNMAVISIQEILRAYLKHIIKIASDQHKCVYKNIHITAPVKQKQQYLQMYKEVLSDYNIEDFAALDEGVAVLYNSIYSQIENNNFEEGDEYKALIIDCGGGTTDLTSCRYSIKDNDIAYELGIITTYANGETNFGGNNITYRIFQYIKILFSSYYEYNKLIDTQDIFENSAGDIYRFVDSNGVDSVYESLNNLFEESEKIIPTK